MAAPRKHQPQRSCIVTRQTLPREELLRFVLSPAGEVVFDLKAALPGRGAWLLPDRQVIEQAVQRRAFNRAFKAQAKVADDLPEQVEQQLRQAALSTLSLARKAGEAVAGFEKVREALRGQEVAVLLEAKDGARDGREKILRLLRAVQADVPLLMSFDSAELGLAFGRERVIHAAMKPGGLARKLLQHARKLQGVAGDAPPVDAPAQEWTGTHDE